MTLKSNIIVSLILFSLLGFFVYQDSKIAINRPTEKNYAIQEGIHSVGYESGKKVYDIKINKIMQKSYRHILFADQLIDGKIFNNKEIPVIRNLKGNNGRVNTHIKSILVTGNISASIYPTTSSKQININSFGFRYNHQKKQSTFFDGININVENKLLTAPTLDYSTTDEIAFFPKSLTITEKNSTTTMTNAMLKINDSKIIATNNIKTIYKKNSQPSDSEQIKNLLKNQTEITAKKISVDFSNDNDTIIQYNTNVLIAQPDKTLRSGQLTLNFKDDIYEVNEGTKLNFNSLKWSLKKNRTIKNKAIKNMLNKKTSIESQQASFDPATNIINFKENVIAKQNNFKLICDNLSYDINKEKIVLTGNVKIYKFGIEYLNSNKIIIDIKNERFTTDSTDNLSEIMIEI